MLQCGKPSVSVLLDTKTCLSTVRGKGYKVVLPILLYCLIYLRSVMSDGSELTRSLVGKPPTSTLSWLEVCIRTNIYSRVGEGKNPCALANAGTHTRTHTEPKHPGKCAHKLASNRDPSAWGHAWPGPTGRACNDSRRARTRVRQSELGEADERRIYIYKAIIVMRKLRTMYANCKLLTQSMHTKLHPPRL